MEQFFPVIWVIVVVTQSAIYLIIFLESALKFSFREQKNIFFRPGQVTFLGPGKVHSTMNSSSSLGLSPPEASKHLCCSLHLSALQLFMQVLLLTLDFEPSHTDHVSLSLFYFDTFVIMSNIHTKLNICNKFKKLDFISMQKEIIRGNYNLLLFLHTSSY